MLGKHVMLKEAEGERGDMSGEDDKGGGFANYNLQSIQLQ